MGTALKKIFPRGSRDVFRFLKNTSLVVIGTAILAFGTGLFIIPFNLVTGGSSGLGIVLAHLLKDVPVIGGLGADIYASVLVWLLFILGAIFLGKQFALQTMVSTIVYPFFLGIGTWLSGSDIMGGFFNLHSEMYMQYENVSIILATVFGGACVGVGSALPFLGGGSTGGSDIIPLVICKYFKKLNTSAMIFITDGTIVLLGMFATKNLVISLLGVVAAFICAIVVDKIFVGESDAFIAQIVSDKYDEINRTIIRQMNRTTTILEAKGGYTGVERKMVMVTFSVRQYAIFTAIIASIDKNAFVTLHRAHEISGDGWTYNIEYNPTEYDPEREEG